MKFDMKIQIKAKIEYYLKEINIGNIYNISRNKINFNFYFHFLFFCLLAITQRKTWQGQFQIVLKTEDNSSPIDNALNIPGIEERSNNLKTQLGILESPSVLLQYMNF